MKSIPDRCRTDVVVGSVVRAMDLLSCFSTDHLEWGVTELAEYLGWPKSAAHRFLQSLVQTGFVERTPTRRYRLGIRALELGSVYSFQNQLLRIADAPLRRLATNTGFSTHLAQSDGSDAIELLKLTGHEANSCKPIRRLRKPLHASALGKTLLAFGSRVEIDRYVGLRKTLTKFTESTITKPILFRGHLRLISERGYAIDNAEASQQRFCLAVPVLDQRGRILAAISVSNSSVRFDDTTCWEYLPQLVAAAHQIEEALVQRPRVNTAAAAFDPCLESH